MSLQSTGKLAHCEVLFVQLMEIDKELTKKLKKTTLWKVVSFL